MKEQNLDHLFNTGLQDFTKEPKADSFNKIRTSFLNEKLIQKVPTWSHFVYSSMAIILAISTGLIYSDVFSPSISNTENTIVSTIDHNERSLLNHNAEFEKPKSSHVKSVISGQENENSHAYESTNPKEKNTISTKTIVAVKESESTKDQIEERVSADTKSNKIVNSNTVKIKNTGQILGLNILRFTKTNDRAYVLEGLIDSMKIISNPKNGQVYYDETSRKFNYLANDGFSGIDSFSYIMYSPTGIEISRGTIKVEVEKDTSSVNPIEEGDNSQQSNTPKNDSVMLVDNSIPDNLEKKKLNQRN